MDNAQYARVQYKACMTSATCYVIATLFLFAAVVTFTSTQQYVYALVFALLALANIELATHMWTSAQNFRNQM